MIQQFLFRYIPKKLKVSWWDLHTHVHGSAFTIAKGGSNPSIHRRMNGSAECKRVTISCNPNREENCDTGIWMKPEDVMLSEISHKKTNTA